MYVLISPADVPALAAIVTTAADGTFTIPNLPPGDYKALTIDGAQVLGAPSYYVSEFYDNAGTTLGDFVTATTFTVTAGTTTTMPGPPSATSSRRRRSRSPPDRRRRSTPSTSR